MSAAAGTTLPVDELRHDLSYWQNPVVEMFSVSSEILW